MSMNHLLDRLFAPGSHDVRSAGDFLSGSASVGDTSVTVIGTRNNAAIGTELALAISGAILDTVEADAGGQTSPRPIVFLVDTQGQALSRHEELLGLNGYFAHVAACVDLARRHGHRIVSVVHGEAVSGGFLAFGLMADRICSLPVAQVRVMDLRAMSRVTKIPHEKLLGLAQESPVFAPGADNYWRMGGIHEMWQEEEDWRVCLQEALALAHNGDDRAFLGHKRSGRQLAAPVATLVEAA